jgi:hypothetical protein
MSLPSGKKERKCVKPVGASLAFITRAVKTSSFGSKNDIENVKAMDPAFSKYLEKKLEDARRGRIDLSLSLIHFQLTFTFGHSRSHESWQ